MPAAFRGFAPERATSAGELDVVLGCLGVDPVAACSFRILVARGASSALHVRNTGLLLPRQLRRLWQCTTAAYRPDAPAGDAKRTGVGRAPPAWAIAACIERSITAASRGGAGSSSSARCPALQSVGRARHCERHATVNGTPL